MPNDAKCGLVVGVGIVLAVAVVFFRKDPPAAEPAVAPVVQTKSRAPAAAVQPPARSPVPGVPVSRPADGNGD